MKILYILFSINSIVDFFCSLYHELWHWLATWLLWFLGYTSRPKLEVGKYPDAKYDSQSGSINVSYSHMCVTYSHYGNTPEILSLFVTIAPVFGVILLLLAPFYMYLLFIPVLYRIWLSPSDILSIKKSTKIIVYGTKIHGGTQE